jgi:hypothetical protein
MKKKSILSTNPYLKNPENGSKLLIRTVLSSSRVEGINITPETLLGIRTKFSVNPSPYKVSPPEHA